MKKGRISKDEESFIKNNITLTPEELGKELSRDPESVLAFIKRKIGRGELDTPPWMEGNSPEKAEYDLSYRPYFQELKQQFTEDELQLFTYHWSRIISQFGDDVIPTEEIQVVDLIKLDLLMNRSLKGNKDNLDQISAIDALILVERQGQAEDQDKEAIFNLERQAASLKASQESLNRDYRDLQDKKNKMLREMRGTREQRVKRIEDSKHNFPSWMAHLIDKPELANQYGKEMEMMRMAMDKEKARLGQFHKYTDGMVDRPFMNPDTVGEYDEDNE